MTSMTPDRETMAPVRPITLVLPEADWAALHALEADPVSWLRQLVRERLERGAQATGCDPLRRSA